MNLTLTRDPTDGVRTFGTMTLPTEPADTLLQTLERPWIPSISGPGGHSQTSCVPLGVYQLVLHDSAAHPKTWALVNPALGVWHQPQDIPAGGTGRTECLIHSANVVAQLAGCIAVGLTRSLLNGEPDVASSVAAFTALKEAVPWIEGHVISITESTP